MTGVRELAQRARDASRPLGRSSSAARNAALLAIAGALDGAHATVLAANRDDCEGARAAGLGDHMLDRLLLDERRLAGIGADVRAIAALPDPVGETFDMRTLANGLQVGKRRVPLGVIGAIYESRPNVTVDIAALSLKSGNACVLRGGKEARRTNRALADIVSAGIAEAGLPAGAVQLVGATDRTLVTEMLQLDDLIDLMIPRGGADLVRLVAREARMPVVAGGIGVCHTYIDASADTAMAVEITLNAKTRRPTICNALDTLLVHAAAAPDVLPEIARAWAAAGVEMRCDPGALEILRSVPGLRVSAAAPEDFGMEFLALIAAVRVVESLDDALAHIEQFGSGHSEAIVTNDYASAMRFLDDVDAAAVYINASTQFTDGGQFGLGAEVGISTQKMHARGPMGLKELTTYKWIILGNGQTRPL
jgi:glutamate-5-semialdehyde dehydrogenase